MIRIIFIAGVCFLCACNSVTVKEYMRNAETSEDYKSEVEYGKYILTCKYKPSVYMALVEINSDLNIKKAKKELMQKFKAAYTNLSGSAFFIVTIGLKSGDNIIKSAVGGPEDYATLTNYLSNAIINDFRIMSDKDIEIKPFIIEYQNSYGNSPVVSLLVSFTKESIKKSTDQRFELQYMDRAFGTEKRSGFSFKRTILEEDIEHIKF